MKTAATVVGCLLPWLALLLLALGIHEPTNFVQEGGAWTLVVLAVMVFGTGAPALAAFTTLPRPVVVAFASLPFLVGAAGSFASSAMVAEAIASVSPADRLTIMAVGTGEVASIFILGCVVGGALLAGTGLALVASARNVGGAFVVGAGMVVVTLGVRWGAVRGGLVALAMASPDQRMMLLAYAASMAQTASFVLLGVAVIATVAALAVALTRREEARQIDSLALIAGSLVVVGIAAATHLRLNAGTAGMTPLPTQPLVAFHGRASSPPSAVIGANHTTPLEGGASRAFAVEPAARGIDIRRAVRTAVGGDEPQRAVADLFAVDDRRAHVEFVAPLPAMRGNLSLPQVLENVLAARVEGVEVDAFAAAGAPVDVMVTIGNVNVDAGVRVVRAVAGTPLSLSAARHVGVVFADDVDAAAFADALSAIDEAGAEQIVLFVSEPGAGGGAKVDP